MMALKDSFLNDLDSAKWQSTHACYQHVMHEKAKKKTKKGAAEELLRLDKWYQETLPELIASRQERHIEVEEMVELVKWKLARGKFRPRLMEYAASNPANEVIKLSRQAFALVTSGEGDAMKNIKNAIQLISKLKGIGPATASAILTAGCQDEVAFMADGPTYAVLESTSLKYTIPEYMAFMDKMRSVSDAFNEQDPSFGWTPHKAEITLWTHCEAKTLGLDLALCDEYIKAGSTNKSTHSVKSSGSGKRKLEASHATDKEKLKEGKSKQKKKK